MPLLKIQTNVEIPADKQQQLILLASSNVAQWLGKPESYVVVQFETISAMCFAGSTEPCAYLELKSIGLPEAQTTVLSSQACQFIADELGIDTNRIYIEFANAARNMWGWDGRTF